MRSSFIHVVAALLLLMQGWVATMRGADLCVRLAACVQSAEIEQDGCDDHSHGPVDPGSHEHDDCGCHIHLPVPDSQQPVAGARIESVQHEPVFALTPVLVPQGAAPVELVGRCRAHPPDLVLRPCALSISTTRLVI